MISQKELNKIYRDKKCVAFDYVIDIEGKAIDIRFKKRESKQWNVRIVLDKTDTRDSNVYEFDYILPKENMDIVMIASIGLRYFQMCLKEEIQTKMNLDFALGEITEGMKVYILKKV